MSTKLKFTRKFEELSKSDVAISGGKGASLGEMTNAGIPVPPGFVILASAFERFLEETDLGPAIDAELKKINYDDINSVDRASNVIRDMIHDVEIPGDLKNKIIQEYKKIPHLNPPLTKGRGLEGRYVAVRSSATAEDSSVASWAGELESYLNTNESNLLENVKNCWSSLFTPRAIFYRKEKKLLETHVGVAVVVQKMIYSEVSGICFTVHPVTEDYNQMIIEAGWGLGEAIVGGMITPDSYVVRKNIKIQEYKNKNTQRILDKNINRQEMMIVREGNGTREIAVPDDQQEKQKLSEKQIFELAEICQRIENHYGFPCDIEWAFEGGKFYIVQSRPITTLINKKPEVTDIFDYIKNQTWFMGVRADEWLLFYSVRQTGLRKYLPKEYGQWFADSLLIPIQKDHPIRVINLAQAKKFHTISEKKIIKNPKVIVSRIKESDLLYQKIKILGKKLRQAIERNDFAQSCKLFWGIVDLYQKASASFMIIFSLGFKLTENRNQLNSISGIIKKHDAWRNSVAFQEEAMGENWYYFFQFILARKNLNIDPKLVMKFLTFNEVKSWFDKKITDQEIVKIVKNRKAKSYIYMSLPNDEREVIEGGAEALKIKKYFLKLQKDFKTEKNRQKLTGEIAYASGRKIRGIILVIKDKSDLKIKAEKMSGKILVAIQTTPHYIPYLKKVKAIITDEGGITCHAAIVSRELKIPCIIGTKIATQVLHDGVLVEVDAEKGIVKILKRNK